MPKAKNKPKKTSNSTNGKSGKITTKNPVNVTPVKTVDSAVKKETRVESKAKPAETPVHRPNILAEKWANQDFRNKFFTVFWSIAGIAVTIAVMFIGFPQLFDQTEAAQTYQTAKAEKDKVAAEQAVREKLLSDENPFIQGENRQVKLSTNFGDIIVEMRNSAAPKSVENFLRLTHRGYFNDTVFHRITKQENFAVLQGGDPTAIGNGGESAFGPGQTVPDELWAVTPEFEQDEAGNYNLSNEPKLQGDGLYRDLNIETGTVVYPKGTIAMAKTSAANSATSQFFIMLTDTTLPAQYTIFGVISPESFAVLDKIYTEVSPKPTENIDGSTTPSNDGIPDKDIRISKAEII